MYAPDLIRKKRDAGTLSREEISFLIESYTRRQIPDYQMSAWVMAVFLQGMTPEETAHLTEAMLHSGKVVDFSGVPGRKVDKHSTGGVGDKTSLVIAPVVAAAGVKVPMISGRGLGHTGGTLDKLESIPGFTVGLTLEEFRCAVAEIGCGLIGQTEEIAPADRKLYALRDVTSTVESIPLITASILSKKLAEGIDALVMDVKVGSGAFMKDMESARQLAQSLQTIGARMGKRVVALLTDMDQPLGNAVGNALEVVEAVETLKGKGPKDFNDLCRELSAWMLFLGEAVADLDGGRKKYDELVQSGAGAKKFQEIIERQGGDPAVVDDPGKLPQAKEQVEFAASESGYIVRIETERVGRAAMALGAGRAKVNDSIDPAVGLVLRKKLGDKVEAGEPLAILHVNRSETLPEVQGWLEPAFQFGSNPLERAPLVRETIE